MTQRKWTWKRRGGGRLSHPFISLNRILITHNTREDRLWYTTRYTRGWYARGWYCWFMGLLRVVSGRLSVGDAFFVMRWWGYFFLFYRSPLVYLLSSLFFISFSPFFFLIPEWEHLPSSVFYFYFPHSFSFIPEGESKRPGTRERRDKKKETKRRPVKQERSSRQGENWIK